MAPGAKAIDLGVEVGQVFLGKYRVDAILGQGGMGVVAQCHHLQLDERVAIKMLRPDVLGDRDAVQRFMREAQAAAKLKSEYVARVSDVGEFENGVPYMVMEFLDGFDLGQMLDEQKSLSVQLVVELMLQACEALADAHSCGIVHRDVKPTNLFVIWRADKPMLKVLDFGISKSAAGSDLKLTQTQSLLGTPAYMSPEQMRSAREVDSRSDIWSLGTVMYEAIEGRRPFEAESFSEMCVKVAMDQPTPMSVAPPALQQVILRCLAKLPEQRFATIADLGRELIPFSLDPHGATALVERMGRMLRRSHTDWEQSSGTGAGQRVPSSIRDVASSPVMRGSQAHMMAAMTPHSGGTGQVPLTPPAQVWTGDSNPAAQQWAGGSTPTGQPLRSQSNPGITNPVGVPMPVHQDGSHPVVRPPAPHSTMLVAVPGKPGGVRRGLWVAVIGIAIAIGVTAGIWTQRETTASNAGSGSGDVIRTADPPVPVPVPVKTAEPPPPVIKDTSKGSAEIGSGANTIPADTGSASGSGSGSGEIEMPDHVVPRPMPTPPPTGLQIHNKPPIHQTGGGGPVVHPSGSGSGAAVPSAGSGAGSGVTIRHDGGTVPPKPTNGRCPDGSLVMDHPFGCAKPR